MSKIIKAKKEHINGISAIMTQLDTKHFYVSDKKKISDFVKKGWYYVIIENKVVAAMSLIPTEGAYEIFSIVSTKPGCGRELIDFAVQKCKKEKIPKLWCWSLKKYNAKGFYEKMGFDEAILLKKQFYGYDCYLFGKVI
jgi:N-acetylglutamate synthase-like GNAT family acetyltransferase